MESILRQLFEDARYRVVHAMEICKLLKDRRLTRELVSLLRDPELGKEYVSLLTNINLATKGGNQRDLDSIINFAAYTRNAWVARKASTLKEGTKVLDVGAGQCQYRKHFSHCDYKTQDLAEYSGTTSGPQKETWKYGEIDYICDIAEMPIADEFFNVVLCSEVLEHVPRPIDALKEISRILARNGRLFLTAPLACGLHQEPFHYYGGYTPHFYEEFLGKCNLKIVELIPIGGLMKHVGQETHRVGRILSEKAPEQLSRLNRAVLMNWLPQYLSDMDDKVFVQEFTIGYMLEARKSV